MRSVAIMIEVTSRHTEFTHFNSDYSQMSAVALHKECVVSELLQPMAIVIGRMLLKGIKISPNMLPLKNT